MENKIKEFKKDLRDLLNDHKAEIVLEELPHSPYSCSEYTIRCYIDGEKAYTLGSYLSYE